MHSLHESIFIQRLARDPMRVKIGLQQLEQIISDQMQRGDFDGFTWLQHT